MEMVKEDKQRLEHEVIMLNHCPNCFGELTNECFPNGSDDYYRALWCKKCKQKYE